MDSAGSGQDAGGVRALRKRFGLTQEQFAGRLGVSFATVNRWENGRSGVSASARRRLAELQRELATAGPPSSGAPPVPVSSFLGRETEVAALTALLDTSRLTSLIGPGGAGKTRLVLEVLRRRPPGSPRAVFVALPPVGGAELADAQIATALGLRDQPGQPAAAAIVRALAGDPALLILDGAEYALARVADLAGQVLAAAAGSRVVVTSRCVLDVPGEQVWPVPVLGCPDRDAGPADVARSDAVRLFAARAAERRPDFQLTGDLAGPVAELCRRLDGLPLAIELAAGWVGTLSIDQILEHRFSLLDAVRPAGGDADDRRAGTLRAVAESSHDLLSPDEQSVLADLSVLAGPFTLADAAAVTAIAPERLAHPLRRLVNSSWLVVRHDPDQAVYRMLDTLREYAAGQLRAAGREAAARARHGRYFATLAQASDAGLAGPERAGWVRLLERSTTDLDAALTWARTTGESAVGLAAGTGLARWWLTSGRLAEGRRWLALFTDLAVGTDDEAGLAQAWRAAALLAAENGDYPTAAGLGRQALRIFDRLGAVEGAAQAATVIGAACRYQGDHAEARRHLELAAAHRRRLGDEAGVAAALNNLAMVAIDTSDLGEAQKLLEETLVIKRRLNRPQSVALNLSNLADVYLKTGQADRAAAALAEASDLSAGLGDVQMTGAIACNQGDLARLRSDHAAAAGHYQRALDCYRAGGNVHDIVLALCGLGVTLHRLGQPGRGTGLLREAETLVAGAGNGNRLPELRAALAETGLASVQTAAPDGLTRRQAEILGYLAGGRTSREIAADLVVSTGTVDRHIATIYRKLGVSNRSQATRYALRHGLLGPPSKDRPDT
jgi:predicted ATPase/DNA-binding CsgD family transcriptional regulator/DNA-binding XRE family transcriptional regulator